jgi:hypothetical protein
MASIKGENGKLARSDPDAARQKNTGQQQQQQQQAEQQSVEAAEADLLIAVHYS